MVFHINAQKDMGFFIPKNIIAKIAVLSSTVNSVMVPKTMACCYLIHHVTRFTPGMLNAVWYLQCVRPYLKAILTNGTLQINLSYSIVENNKQYLTMKHYIIIQISMYKVSNANRKACSDLLHMRQAWKSSS